MKLGYKYIYMNIEIIPVFSFFRLTIEILSDTYFSHIANSSIAIDDITYYVKHGIFNTNL